MSEAAEVAPGVSLHRVGPRNEGMLYIRGFDLRQVPLFIDGIPVYVPYDGYVDLDRFVTDDLSEVRITKGLTSVLIGPNALGGAINLVTKRPTKPFDGLFNVTYGSGAERAFDTTVGMMRPGWYAQGTGSWLQADNFPLSGDFVANALEDGGARNNSSRRDAKASLKFALTPTGRGEYAAHLHPSARPERRAAVRRHQQRGSSTLLAMAGLGQGQRLLRVEHTAAGSQYVKGRAYYDRFYNELGLVRRRAVCHHDPPVVVSEHLRRLLRRRQRRIRHGDRQAGRRCGPPGHFKEDIHREHNIGEPIRHFNNRTVSVGIEDSITISPTVSLVAGIGADRQSTIQAENFVAGVVSDFPAGTTGGVNPQVGVFVATPGGGPRARRTCRARPGCPRSRIAIRIGWARRFRIRISGPSRRRRRKSDTTGACHDMAACRWRRTTRPSMIWSNRSSCSRICFSCRTSAT